MEYQAKLNVKYTPVLHCISSFEGTSYKKSHDTTSPFVSCCFTLVFTCISKYDILELFRNLLTIIRKYIFVTNSNFLMIHPNPSTLLAAKIYQV